MYRPKMFERKSNESGRQRWNRCVRAVCKELKGKGSDRIEFRLHYLTSVASGYAMGSDYEKLRRVIYKRIGPWF